MTYWNGWLRRSAVRMFSPRMVERVIDPVLADIATEYEQAIQQGRVWVSRWVRAVGHATLLRVVALCLWERTVRTVRHSTADDQQAVGRILGCSAAALVVTTLLLLLPFILRYRIRAHVSPLILMMYLTPSQLTLSIPIGCSLGILYGLRGLVVSWRSKAGVLFFAVACMVSSFVTIWFVPTANQAFRVSAYGNPNIVKGSAELTLRELSQRIDEVAHSGQSIAVWRLSFDYHVRWALSGATLVLALFSLSLVSRHTGGRFLLGVTACAAYLGYYTLHYAGRALALYGTLPAAAAAWLPNTALALVAVALLTLPPRSVASNRPT